MQMTCMTTKKKFDIENPPVVVLANGRYAYRCEIPWPGKNGKVLHAFKFCSADAFKRFTELTASGAKEQEPEVADIEVEDISGAKDVVDLTEHAVEDPA